MKKITVIAMAIGLVLVFSQTQAQNANYRRYQAKGRKLQPATVETVKGKVDLVETFAAKRGGGIHITVSAGKENVRVALGPALLLMRR
jgi:predicted lipoprotein